MTVPKRLRVNHEDHYVEIPANERLVDTLRVRLGLTGTKVGCRAGECGACTVLIGQRSVLACVALTVSVREPILTIEGLDPSWSGLKSAFAEEGGFQCGFCTPGQVMRAVGVLSADDLVASSALRNPECWVRAQMNGNICRCTGYAGITRAVISCLDGIDSDAEE
jgi:aerobic-type carbon monoxide dehydrogenase small subunit (CoxS/CutS family)